MDEFSEFGALLEESRLKRTVANVVACIRKHKLDCKYIAVSGISGLLVGPMVTMKLKKNLLIIRKRDERAHSNQRVEGPEPIARSQNYIILDDFIASGATIQHILKSVHAFEPSLRCVGILLYARYDIPHQHHRLMFPNLMGKILLPVYGCYNLTKPRTKKGEVNA